MKPKDFAIANRRLGARANDPAADAADDKSLESTLHS
jgi:hypothetical protein